MTERHEEALEELRALLGEIGEHAESCGYGYFPGGTDPNDFSPDPECCSDEEIAAHKAACERWNAGDRAPLPGPHEPIVDADGNRIGHITVAHFGIGTYSYQDETMADWRDRLSRCIARLERDE